MGPAADEIRYELDSAGHGEGYTRMVFAYAARLYNEKKYGTKVSVQWRQGYEAAVKAAYGPEGEADFTDHAKRALAAITEDHAAAERD